MLTNLTIQNFSLIDKLSIEFGPHLNVLTGETGAGKSIVIDALRYVLGERLSSSQIRNPELPCVVEVVFELARAEIRLREIVGEFLPVDESQLIIHRTHLPDGKSKIKINGFFITLTQLKEIGNHLIDFHGAHDHQLLFADEYHLDIVDKLSSLTEFKTQYDSLYTQYRDLKKQLNELQELGQSRQRDLDLLEHQVNELKEVALEESAYDEIKQEQIRLNNAEKLHTYINQILQIVDDEQGLSERIRQAFPPLRGLNQIDDKTAGWHDYLNAIQENTRHLMSELNDYAQKLSFEPGEAKEINRRYDVYEDIKRKYGPTLDEAKQFFEESKIHLELLKNFEENNTALIKKLETQEKKLRDVAQKMTKERQKTSQALKKTIEKELTELGIAHVQFESRVEPTDLGANGQDKVTFYISPNAGESLKPLSQIVSSGEAARLMLALKKALIKVDPIPVLIFDEIDAQIGGRLGTITGTKLKEISRNRQVILITHLPQIASFGHQHFKVTKDVEKGRAVTKVTSLDSKARVEELAKMMSGEKESSIALTHAKTMLAEAQR